MSSALALLSRGSSDQTSLLTGFTTSDTLIVMATKNPRLQVVLEKPLYDAVASLAKREGVSLSLKARDLIREALEHLEDIALADIVRERAAKPARLLTQEELESRLGR